MSQPQLEVLHPLQASSCRDERCRLWALCGAVAALCCKRRRWRKRREAVLAAKQAAAGSGKGGPAAVSIQIDDGNGGTMVTYERDAAGRRVLIGRGAFGQVLTVSRFLLLLSFCLASSAAIQSFLALGTRLPTCKPSSRINQLE